ncbi:hypothetical protein FA95DRAFT_1523422 [Auriscalpium vulgare]|uniref:Uncharacterized protein n=1 Tax=Auriscalpium vulgare TaxID=40419 RepID=A0ACB8RJK2_9AGAM|nr:hypothetical protein FA95DRAFT_1523422 [Auriscalpium vulgare]
MQSALRDIARRRNALTPTCAIPPELLTEIFRAYCAVVDRQAESVGVPLRWIKVTHVCFHWRQTALACATLWADIPLLQSDACVAEMVARSGSVALTLRDRLPPNAHCGLKTAKADIVVSTLGRTQMLELQISTSPAALMERLTSAPAPELEKLQLGTSSEALHALPQDFLAGAAPRLRHLCLRNVVRTIHWTSGLLRGLTSLDVAVDQSAPSPSLDTVLDALRNMPRLECLAMRLCLPHAASLSNAAILDLPIMKESRPDGPWLDVIYLLAHFRLPANVKLRLQLDMGVSINEEHDYRPLLPLLATYFRATDKVPFPILEFVTTRNDWRGDLYLLAWRTPTSRAPAFRDGHRARIQLGAASTQLTSPWARVAAALSRNTHPCGARPRGLR